MKETPMDLEHEPAPLANPGPVARALRRPRVVAVALVVALAAVVGLAFVGLRSDGSTSASSKGPRVETAGSQGAQVGKVAPSFSVTTLSGSTFRVPTDKPTALWFTANGCRSCIPKAQALDRIKADVGERLAVLGVDINPTDTESVFRAWIKEVGNPRFDFAMDQAGELTLAWGVRDTSTVVIVDGKGKVVYNSAGAANEAVFRAALAEAGLA